VQDIASVGSFDYDSAGSRRAAKQSRVESSGLQRQPELDALRGLMLMLMTLAHLPTHAQVVTNQQLGFVSEAEGFVFLSAFLTGRILRT
jgi:hypothetical protein